MAKQQTNGIYKPRNKNKKGRASKSKSTNKQSKNYRKPYKGQGK